MQLFDEESEWVWKWDTGSESNVEKEKGQVSDAFKRAAVKWGIGRFLYDLEIAHVKTDGPLTDSHKYPLVVDDSGNRVWDLTKHMNNGSRTAPAAPKVSKPAVVSAAEAKEAALKKEIVDLCHVKSEIPLFTKEDIKAFILKATALVYGEAKNAEIIERLKAI